MLNVALLGYGRIGQMHAENLFNHSKFNLLYVYDKNYKLALKSKNKFKNKVITNYKIALNDKKVDIIFIASPTPTHIKFIEESVFFNKIVFCEKPLDLNISKVKACIKKLSKKNPKIQLGFNRRYDPGHFQLKKDLKKKKIGILQKIIITSRDPAPPPINYLKESGGLFKDMMIHDFDLCRFYLENDEIIELSATASSFTNFYKKIKDHELASVTMKSRKGVICVITNSRQSSYGYDQRVELFGSKGMLISGNQNTNQTEIYNSSSTSSKKPYLNFFIERYKDAYKNQLNDLAKFAKKNIKPRSVFLDGYKALELAENANSSFKLKKVIKTS
jgi:myo-inositol 2-dehydrogenase/D-chiro-inositol 1-dehydrogenase